MEDIRKCGEKMVALFLQRPDVSEKKHPIVFGKETTITGISPNKYEKEGKHMKHFLRLFLVSVIVVCLVACGTDGYKNSSQSETVSISQADEASGVITKYGGVTFDVPSEWASENNDEFTYYYPEGDSKTANEMMMASFHPIDILTEDNVEEQLDLFVDGLDEAEGTREMKRSKIQIDDVDSLQANYTQCIDGIDFNVVTYVIPVKTDGIFALWFGSNGKSETDYTDQYNAILKTLQIPKSLHVEASSDNTDVLPADSSNRTESKHDKNVNTKEKQAREKAEKKAEKAKKDMEEAEKQAEQKVDVEKQKSDTSTSLSDAMSAVDLILQSSYGDNHTLEYDDKTVTINLWAEGIATGVYYAKEGDQSCLENWKMVIDSQTELSKTIAETLDGMGFEDMIVTVNTLNELDKEKVLLSNVNGNVIYNAVES